MTKLLYNMRDVTCFRQSLVFRTYFWHVSEKHEDNRVFEKFFPWITIVFNKNAK